MLLKVVSHYDFVHVSDGFPKKVWIRRWGGLYRVFFFFYFCTFAKSLKYYSNNCLLSSVHFGILTFYLTVFISYIFQFDLSYIYQFLSLNYHTKTDMFKYPSIL